MLRNEASSPQKITRNGELSGSVYLGFRFTASGLLATRNQASGLKVNDSNGKRSDPKTVSAPNLAASSGGAYNLTALTDWIRFSLRT